MNHSRAQDLLSPYLEDDLSEADRSAVESHLAACAGCAEDLSDLRGAVALLRRLPAPEPPPFLASRVMARIADGEARPGGFRRWLAQASAPIIAAPLAAAAAALLVFVFASPPVDDGQTQLAVARLPVGPRVNQLTGPSERGPVAAASISERPPVQAASAVVPDLLALQLRGAGHPYSVDFAHHFDRPTEAVAVARSH